MFLKIETLAEGVSAGLFLAYYVPKEHAAGLYTKLMDGPHIVSLICYSHDALANETHTHARTHARTRQNK